MAQDFRHSFQNGTHVLLKNSRALDIPNGSLLKQYRPKGVIKVVRCLDGSVKGTCQNPLLASNLENTLAPANRARVSSTGGMGCTYRSTFPFKCFKSTHILMLPDFFWTTIMPECHSVCWSTLLITPEALVRASSFRTLSHRGIEIMLAVNSE